MAEEKEKEERQMEVPTSGDEEESDDSDERHLCTFAVTGPHPRFQPVFICRTCHVLSSPDGGEGDGAPSTEGSALLCICQGCAEACHGGHDVVYVGLGPCYCDCPSTSRCSLAEASEGEARRLGLDGPLPAPPPLPVNNAAGESGKGGGGLSFPFRHGVYTLPPLVDEEACAALRVQAEELIRHTSDTHWVPCAPAAAEEFCDLERLARIVYLRHVEAFGLADERGDGGAEWWVQVKEVTGGGGGAPRIGDEIDNFAEEGTADSATAAAGGGREEAIDLHYDKDEDLAASFGIGSFPAISTVTYLTAGGEGGGGGEIGGECTGGDCAGLSAAPPAPTVVLPHTYDADESAEMSCALLSHPARGKHLAFDGRLLHGAPAHHSLRRHRRRNLDWRRTATPEVAARGGGAGRSVSCGVEGPSSSSTMPSAEPRGASARVTFLVNVWPSGRPSGVGVLRGRVRRRIAEVAGARPLAGALAFLRDGKDGGTRSLEFSDRPVSTIGIEREEGQSTGRGDEDRGAAEQQRVLLPFVSSGATWIDDDMDGGLVLSLVPPPSAVMGAEDTYLVQYEAGWGPQLQRLEGDEVDEEDEDSVTAGAGEEH